MSDSLLQASQGSRSQGFSLEVEEIVFASKLSDENRRAFCYILSGEQRQKVLESAKTKSPNESVKVFLELFVETEDLKSSLNK